MMEKPKNCKECEYVCVERIISFSDLPPREQPTVEQYFCSLTGEDCRLFLKNNHIRLDCPVKWEEQK